MSGIKIIQSQIIINCQGYVFSFKLVVEKGRGNVAFPDTYNLQIL